jgi:hypothetical protein
MVEELANSFYLASVPFLLVRYIGFCTVSSEKAKNNGKKKRKKKVPYFRKYHFAMVRAQSNKTNNLLCGHER